MHRSMLARLPRGGLFQTRHQNTGTHQGLTTYSVLTDCDVELAAPRGPRVVQHRSATVCMYVARAICSARPEEAVVVGAIRLGRAGVEVTLGNAVPPARPDALRPRRLSIVES